LKTVFLEIITTGESDELDDETSDDVETMSSLLVLKKSFVFEMNLF